MPSAEVRLESQTMRLSSCLSGDWRTARNPRVSRSAARHAQRGCTGRWRWAVARGRRGRGARGAVKAVFTGAQRDVWLLRNRRCRGVALADGSPANGVNRSGGVWKTSRGIQCRRHSGSCTQRDETGLLVPVRDANALRDALEKMHDKNLRERLGTAAHIWWRKQYTRERMAEQLEETYRNVLGR